MQPALPRDGEDLKISIVSPTHNHSKYLPQNLDSLLGQEYLNFEVIVVNDASTDETHEVLTEYERKHPRLKYLRLDKNKGTIGAFNEGLKIATGDMIYGSASDDYLATPHFLRMVSTAMKQKPEAAGVFGQAEMVSAETGKSIGMLGGVAGRHGYVPPEICVRAFFSHQMLIPGVSCVWRRDLVERIGGYPEDLGPQSDYFVNHTAASLAGVVYLPKKVAVHRMSTNSYNANVETKRRIRNYVLAEKRMRVLGLHQHVPQELINSWRERLIIGLMAIEPQTKIFQIFKDIIGQLNSEFWSYVPEKQKAFFQSIPVECEKQSEDLIQLKNWAMQEFRKETGV
jgi:glycosyltransferase involved in cell wall biosynthesis